MTYNPNQPPPIPGSQPPPGYIPPVGYPPQGYAPIGYAYSMPSPRPTSVSVISIIGIVLASLTLLCTPIGLIPYLIPANASGGNAMAMFGGNSPIVQLAHTNTMFHSWTLGAGLVNLLMALWLLIASIGALRLATWGRSSTILYAVVQLIVIAVSLTGQAVYVLPLMLRSFPPNDPMRRVIMTSMIGGGSIGIAIALALPIAILICYRRRHVVEAFARGRM